MESPQPTSPDRESTDESLNLQIENPADKTFLRKVNTEYKKQDNNVSVYSRMTMGVEIPILVLSSINVSALVSTFFTSDTMEVVGKAISLGLTTLGLILLGMKKLLDPERKREKAIGLRNKLQGIKLRLVDAIASRDTDKITKLKAEAMDVLGDLEE